MTLKIRPWTGATLAAALAVGGVTLSAGRGQAVTLPQSTQHHASHMVVLFLDGGLRELYNKQNTPFIASLADHGIQYSQATAGVPGDSVPDILDAFTGNDPTHTGIPYETFYDRSLKQDIHLTEDYILAPSKPNPWDYMRKPTVFEAAHQRGLTTVFYSKHKAYSALEGRSGTGLTSFVWHDPDTGDAGALGSGAVQPVMTPANLTCASQDYVCLEQYDAAMFKALTATLTGPQQPNIAGLYLLAPNSAEKTGPEFAAANNVKVGGLVYGGQPAPAVADALAFEDHQVEALVASLQVSHRWADTSLIITSDHGQAPVTPNPCAAPLNGTTNCTFIAPADIATYLGQHNIGVTLQAADAVDLIWLKDPNQAVAAVAALRTPAAQAKFAIDYVLTRDGLADQGVAPVDRTPDLALQPLAGFDYDDPTSSKVAEHGGFSATNLSVPLIITGGAVSGNTGRVVDQPVLTTQLAATIAETLGIEFNSAAFRALPTF